MIQVHFILRDVSLPSFSVECNSAEVAITLKNWFLKQGAEAIVTRTTVTSTTSTLILACDLCGKPVPEETFDIVTHSPRHNTCIPF